MGGRERIPAPFPFSCKLPLDNLRKLHHTAPMSNTATELIGAQTAAEILSLSVAQVNRLAADGQLPTATKLPGRTGAYVFTREAVTAYAAKRNAA